jgi:N-acetylmuramoyl-L-alanine amidase
VSIYACPLNAYTRRKSTTQCVIHCADTVNGKGTMLRAKTVRTWHVDERKWLDIGYHFFIGEDGTLEVGRPIWAIGSHVAGYNAGSIGICMAGGKNGENDYTDAQWRTLKALVATIRALHPAIEVLGHRDFPGVNKYCPSFDVAEWLKKEKL